MPKKTIENQTEFLTTYEIGPLKDMVFFKKAKEEEFINKVNSLDYRKVRDYIQIKLVWTGVIWLITIIITMLVQKYFDLF